MQEFRCKTDHKLLLKACLIEADIEVKCRGCGTINTFTMHDGIDPKFACYKDSCEHRVVEKTP